MPVACPKCSYLYELIAETETYCPECGWEYYSAKREVDSQAASKRSKKLSKTSFPFAVLDKSFLFKDKEYSFDGVQSIRFEHAVKNTTYVSRWFGSPSGAQCKRKAALFIAHTNGFVSHTRKTTDYSFGVVEDCPASMWPSQQHLKDVYHSLSERTVHYRLARYIEIVTAGDRFDCGDVRLGQHDIRIRGVTIKIEGTSVLIDNGVIAFSNPAYRRGLQVPVGRIANVDILLSALERNLIELPKWY